MTLETIEAALAAYVRERDRMNALRDMHNIDGPEEHHNGFRIALTAALKVAVEGEREACAKIADNLKGDGIAEYQIAAAIRARRDEE